ncbi:molybdopterin-synthase adenylyltransferase MoeB [Candidatus Sumerlaeota bacterium]|nr:molybdopterin-synthase adenylyltransferase MoeB [Candidatus Sumerlaeota bacterium]
MAFQGFSDDQLERYARHIILPQIGGKGQRRLLDSRVFVVGAGGLGSPILLYLAAAGVGTIDVIDSDRVDLSNLQRQIIHDTARIGQPKVESARAAIGALNPDVKLNVLRERLTRDNALSLMRDAQVVLDGSDNFATRYLVNDACWFLKKPLVSGAMLRFEGQVTVFPMDGGADSPCYRCLFPEPPPADLIPTCQEAGVLGVLPGVIGSLQATEAVKLLLGIGNSLVGRLLVYDALDMTFRTIKLHRDKHCALNGDAPTQNELAHYDEARCEAPESSNLPSSSSRPA